MIKDPISLPTHLDEALVFFDSLPPVSLDFMWGEWEGAELPTGHPMDGLLGATGWYGK
ncbi:MAG: GXWXG domain-containing protein, partial [Bacteroidota bacterium]